MPVKTRKRWLTHGGAWPHAQGLALLLLSAMAAHPATSCMALPGNFPAPDGAAWQQRAGSTPQEKLARHGGCQRQQRKFWPLYRVRPCLPGGPAPVRQKWPLQAQPLTAGTVFRRSPACGIGWVADIGRQCLFLTVERWRVSSLRLGPCRAVVHGFFAAL